MPEATDKAIPLYQVKDWDSRFEGAKSKTYNNKSSCTMPTKHGLGYKRLVKRKDGAAIFGAWCSLIQVLSRHEKPRQGYCTDTGGIGGVPYSPSDLECLTDIPERYFKMMFDICSSQIVGWLIRITTGIPQGYRKDTKYPLDSNSDSNSNSDLNSNPKPPKRPYGEFQNVKLTDSEYQKLVDSKGKTTVESGIDILDSYIESKGKKYRSHYAVMKGDSWVWDRVASSATSSPARIQRDNNKRKVNSALEVIKGQLKTASGNDEMWAIICTAPSDVMFAAEEWAEQKHGFVRP